MAAGDINYGSKTALANVSRLDSDVANYATAFGEVDNSSEKAEDYYIRLYLPISSSATTGTYDIYMVESMEGTEWTDGIDPATDADYLNFIKDAIPIRGAATVYGNSPTGARTAVQFHFHIQDYVAYAAPYFGFVRVNRSGQTAPSTADGDSQTVKRATS